MQSVILLAVLGVWVAVIVPPLMRNRTENRPNSSVSDFRRQLSTLQRTVPTRSMGPMRGMARPLTQAPHHQRTQVAHQRQGAMQSAGFPRPQAGYQGQHNQHGEVRRPAAADRSHQAHRQAHLQRVSAKEMQRRRRANVLFVIVVATGITGFLAATTKTDAMVYSFAISFVSLCGYCYKLVQLRNMEMDRNWQDSNWFNAA